MSLVVRSWLEWKALNPAADTWSRDILCDKVWSIEYFDVFHVSIPLSQMLCLDSHVFWPSQPTFGLHILLDLIVLRLVLLVFRSSMTNKSWCVRRGLLPMYICMSTKSTCMCIYVYCVNAHNVCDRCYAMYVTYLLNPLYHEWYIWGPLYVVTIRLDYLSALCLLQQICWVLVLNDAASVAPPLLPQQWHAIS